MESISLNASIRRDGSSRFGRAVKFGDFPSVSVAWRPLEEGFLKEIVNKNIIDDLRLEAGYGVTGNQQIANATNPNYVFLGGVSQGNYIFGGVSTLGNTLGSIPNDGLTWEESRQVDFGVNASMFKKRLTIAANIYRTETVGLFNQIPVPNITGTGSVIGNSGRMENKGFERHIPIIIFLKTKTKSAKRLWLVMHGLVRFITTVCGNGERC
jgi:TonB-dependent starch-binding outer membrane protein SusC